MKVKEQHNIPIYDMPQAEGDRVRPIRIITAKATPFMQKKVWLSAHRKDYYLLMYITKGSGRHWVDMIPYEYNSDTFYFSSPEQIHVKEDVKLTGTVITFNREFLALAQNQDLGRLPLLQNLQNAHELKISPDQKAELESILEKCIHEFQQDADLQTEMLYSYVRVLLIFLSRIYNIQYNEKEPNLERDVYRRFQSCIEENYKKIHDAGTYADMLNISISHLNTQIRAQSGKTVMTHLHERLILEAKRILFHTNFSVKEIAYSLGFHDTSYFNRFFKKITGVTPVTYRQDTGE
jgi:AraC-like DNA-binding protein